MRDVHTLLLFTCPQRSGTSLRLSCNSALGAKLATRKTIPFWGRPPSGLACVAKQFYWLTRPCLWRKLSVLHTASLSHFANVATAHINSPSITFTSRASLIKHLHLTVSADCNYNPCWLYTLMLLCTRLEILEFELTSITIGNPQPIPYPLILGIDVGHPPLHRVAFSGDAYVPSIAQLEVLLGTVTDLEVLELSNCLLGTTDRHLYPTTNGPSNITSQIKSLCLDPSTAINFTSNVMSFPVKADRNTCGPGGKWGSKGNDTLCRMVRKRRLQGTGSEKTSRRHISTRQKGCAGRVQVASQNGKTGDGIDQDLIGAEDCAGVLIYARGWERR